MISLKEIEDAFNEYITYIVFDKPKGIQNVDIDNYEIKNNQKFYDNLIDKEIEDAFNEYITYIVFDKPNGIQNVDIDNYENDPFGYTYQKMLQFIDKYPRIYEIKPIDEAD